MHTAEGANVVRARRADDTKVASGGGLAARGRECRNNCPRAIFQTHGKAHDLQVIGK